MDKPDKSLPWFADRGHHQLLAGYYDAPPEHILDWLKSARGVPGIDAALQSTTRENNDAIQNASAQPSTAFARALAASARQLPLAHVESLFPFRPFFPRTNSAIEHKACILTRRSQRCL